MKKKVKTGAQMVSLLELAKKTTQDKFLTIQKKLAFDAFDDLVKTTPVDTGLARSNWRIAVNNAPDEEDDRRGSKDEAYFIPTFSDPSIRFGDTIILYNNTSYIRYLEEGSSVQAPNGMIEQAYARADIMAGLLLLALSGEKANV